MICAISSSPRLGHESVVVNNDKLLMSGGGLVEDGRFMFTVMFCFHCCERRSIVKEAFTVGEQE